MAKQDDYIRYTIRVPSDLYDRLQQAAGNASVNAEIIRRLSESFDGDREFSELMKLVARGDALNNAYQKQIELLEALLAGVVDTAGDRIPDRMQELLRPLRPGSDTPDHYATLLNKLKAGK